MNSFRFNSNRKCIKIFELNCLFKNKIWHQIEAVNSMYDHESPKVIAMWLNKWSTQKNNLNYNYWWLLKSSEFWELSFRVPKFYRKLELKFIGNYFWAELCNMVLKRSKNFQLSAVRHPTMPFAVRLPSDRRPFPTIKNFSWHCPCPTSDLGPIQWGQSYTLFTL